MIVREAERILCSNAWIIALCLLRVGGWWWVVLPFCLWIPVHFLVNEIEDIWTFFSSLSFPSPNPPKKKEKKKKENVYSWRWLKAEIESKIPFNFSDLANWKCKNVVFLCSSFSGGRAMAMAEGGFPSRGSKKISKHTNSIHK